MNKKKKIALGKSLPSFTELIKIIGTFSLVAFTFIIFRAKSVSDAFHYYQGIFSRSSFPVTEFERKAIAGESFVTIFLLIFLLILEWKGRNDQYAIEHFGHKYPRIARFLFYAFILFLIGMYAPTNETPFIYLKF